MPGFAVTDEEESYSPRGDMLRINQDINRDMTVPEVMASLTDHGCEDITSSLNLEKCDQLPTEIRSSGDLYRGVLGDGREIAIKCIQPTFTLNNENSNIIKSAAHELYIWSKLSHPNVVQLMGLADYHMRLAMISPWVENSDLSRYLYTHRPPQEERLKMGAQIADGLAYLHGVGMVHGDLKAANISISANSTAVITGFGNSIIKEHSVEFTNSTKGVNISIRWTAPELLMGQGIPSQMADVWALGMVYLQLASYTPISSR
ncbi:unnamed protein product [Rhizoctonia solani]|uniref:Protein kinase domain-containing protein n=1 Tax=Rhizoctonia solani TaxID=456999 RepID=A0A8H3H2T2_9AGAM|nr:unnamed protein product [Rhizoctonia solani]